MTALAEAAKVQEGIRQVLPDARRSPAAPGSADRRIGDQATSLCRCPVIASLPWKPEPEMAGIGVPVIGVDFLEIRQDGGSERKTGCDRMSGAMSGLRGVGDWRPGTALFTAYSTFALGIRRPSG